MFTHMHAYKLQAHKATKSFRQQLEQLGVISHLDLVRDTEYVIQMI